MRGEKVLGFGKAAIVIAGSFLLLGARLAVAQAEDIVYVELDDPADDAADVRSVAVETIRAADTVMQGGAVLGYGVRLSNANSYFIAASARTRIPAGYHIRVTLDGAVYVNQGALGPSISLWDAGGSGSTSVPVENVVQFDNNTNFVVVSLPRALSQRPSVETDLNIGISIIERILSADGFGIAVTDTEPGPVTATIQAFRDLIDAIDGTNPVGFEHFGGSGVYFQKASGLIASVAAGTRAVADAEVGFRRFVAEGVGSPSAVLGSFTVHENTSGRIRNAANGIALAVGNLIGTLDANSGRRPVTLVVEGELGIGAFSLTRTATAPPNPTMSDVMCPDASAGTPAAPLAGNVVSTDEMPNMGTRSVEMAGTHTLCVTVDTMGEMSNTMPLRATEFMGSIRRAQGDSHVELASGVVGRIERNGATAEIDFLTTAPKYNQRLIIVNYGNRDVDITDVVFNTEGDAEAMLMDGVERTIGAGERKVYVVSDMIEVTGRNRTAATIALNGAPNHLSVATTVVNREDNSTDTVMWPVN